MIIFKVLFLVLVMGIASSWAGSEEDQILSDRWIQTEDELFKATQGTIRIPNEVKYEYLKSLTSQTVSAIQEGRVEPLLSS